jgi:hypothetical protein
MLLVLKKKLLVFSSLLLLALNGVASAQSSSQVPAFVAVGFGPFWSERSGFAETYGSGPVLAGSVGFGLPVAHRLHLYGKVLYIARKSVDATAHFQQWLIDGGLQYSLPFVYNMTIAFQGGAAYSVVSEDITEADGSSTSLHGKGIQGLFLGLGAERPLDRSSWSVFAEVQYNPSWSDAASILSDYGGSSISLGLRYRFSDKNDSDSDTGAPPSIWGR